ncbi:MAG: DUF3465 domain-containing protein [Phormidesmis sp.]
MRTYSKWMLMRFWTAALLLVSTVLAAPKVLPANALSSSMMAAPAVFWQSMAKTSGDKQVLHAYKNQLSNVIVEDVSGTVDKLLTDDLEGSRHQRFILRVTPGHTVLVVHNIDLAPRVNDLREGDRLSVKGEYEWNDRGGLIHWTHRDPNSRHEDGWIIHGNVRYE